MPACLQFFSQLDVIVYFAVEDHGDAAGSIPHRLRTAADIDDGEPSIAKPNLVAFGRRIREPVAGAIRSTAGHQIGQSAEKPMILAPRAR